jgi:hypothetical protein
MPECAANRNTLGAVGVRGRRKGSKEFGYLFQPTDRKECLPEPTATCSITEQLPLSNPQHSKRRQAGRKSEIRAAKLKLGQFVSSFPRRGWSTSPSCEICDGLIFPACWADFALQDLEMPPIGSHFSRFWEKSLPVEQPVAQIINRCR